MTFELSNLASIVPLVPRVRRRFVGPMVGGPIDRGRHLFENWSWTVELQPTSRASDQRQPLKVDREPLRETLAQGAQDLLSIWQCGSHLGARASKERTGRRCLRHARHPHATSRQVHTYDPSCKTTLFQVHK